MNATIQSRLSRDKALSLLRDMPLLELGRLAFERKRTMHGDTITYVNNHHINPTNLCVFSCKFCDYKARKGDDHAYELNESDILAQLESPAIQEAHIVGGLWPTWGYKRSMQLVRMIREARPNLWIKAFTAVEVAYFAQMERRDVITILKGMMDAGVDMMPGGGAEVLNERIHTELYKDKIGPSEWINIHEQAHRLGLPSNATLLFGHIETDEEIIDHLFTLLDLQDRSPGFHSFIPLAYQPGTTGLTQNLVSAPKCLRVIALARLVLDNIPHIKAYWPTLQEETAVAALNFGADDLDGTLGNERIMQLAGTASPAEQSANHLACMIRQAGQVPQERDGQYHPVLNKEIPALPEVG